jgi:SAM-dependent methyltransferase
MASGFTTLDWYDTPRYYDLVFEEDTELETAFLEAMFARHATCRRRARPRVYEPACGSGRLVRALARAGWSVVGSDLSRPMLDFARARLADEGLGAVLAKGDMASYAPRGRFELAHCFVSTFKYLLTEADARAHLERVAEALLPGGIYVLGFHLTDYGRTSRSRERWVVDEDDTRVVCTIQGWPADKTKRLEAVRSRLVVTEQGQELRSETSWQFRTYDARQVRRLLGSVLALEHVGTYDFRYDPQEPCEFGGDQEDTILILRRREDSRS